MLRSFQNGRLPVLIVPDQLPAELDASTITHLVNFDLPRQPAYLARLQAVPDAVVCSLVTPMEEQSLLDLEDKLGHPLWRDLVSDFDYTSETPAELPVAVGPGLPPLWRNGILRSRALGGNAVRGISGSDRKSTRLNSSHRCTSRMPSSA